MIDERTGRLYSTLKIAAEHWSEVENWPYEAVFEDHVEEGVFFVTLPPSTTITTTFEKYRVIVERIS